jgi:nicotinate-nucleotide pyrophosphorylase (carboxylating)
VQIEPLDPGYVAELVAAAIDEDRATDDVTTLATVPEGLQGRAVFLAKQPGVAAGLGIAQAVFRDLSLVVAFEPRVGEGERFAMGAELAIVEARAQALLQGERVALNFLQRLCATATLTRQFVDAIAGTRAVILDTRKTTPGLRDAEKYAVRCGGGTNHRRDLASMAMLKDNHLAAIARSGGSIADAVTAVREFSPGIAVEVEIDGLDQLEAALAAAPEWILLDNMPVDTTREAVVRTAGRAKLEASGGVNLSNVRAIAETGVDAISVGALTHSAGSLDISMELTF